MDKDRLISIIESLLFATDKPLSFTGIQQIFNDNIHVEKKDIKEAIESYRDMLLKKNRGITLEEIDEGYQLRTKVENRDHLKKMTKKRPFRVSGPALEVLSIIAYKQPLIKSRVDEIRGIESGHLLRVLMEKGLICFAGKSDLPGKPIQYKTTRHFLKMFSLKNLKDLPTLSQIEELLPDGIDTRSKDSLDDMTTHLSIKSEKSYSENEDELNKIVDTLSKIETSTVFFEKEKRKKKEKRKMDKAENIRKDLDSGLEVSPRDVKWLEKFEKKQSLSKESDSTSFTDSDTDCNMLEESLDI